MAATNESAARSVAAAPGDRPLPLLPSAFWIAWFSYREMARRRRLVAIGAVMLVPVALAAAWRLLDRSGTVSATLLLSNLGGVVYVPFLTALVSLAFGLSAIGEEVEEGTILYYWTRPIGRGAIYIGRLIAAQTVAASLLVVSLALCFVAIVAGNFAALSGRFVGLYLATAGVIVLGAFVYTAIFAALGTWLKRPLPVALLFAFGWETMSNVPARIQQLTVVFHLRNLIRNAESGTASVPNLLLEFMRRLQDEPPPPQWQSVVTLLATTAVFALLGAWLLRRKEIFR
jgi:ABC-type transport system involved in multi-copper enzyme maturation permease subunit